MNRTEIESAVGLKSNANTRHEDARDWYGDYGWHLSTEHAGDVLLQAIEFDWLDESDVEVGGKLLSDNDDLSEDEAIEIIRMARSVREMAENIDSLLDDAVDAYERGDLDETRKALLAAYAAESEAGDEPATKDLADRLLSDVLTMYRVYEAPEGCSQIFCGEFPTLQEAVACADSEPAGLEKSLWDTARAAGHCGGMSAPEGGEEGDEPLSWHGAKGNYCVVRVEYRSE